MVRAVEAGRQRERLTLPVALPRLVSALRTSWRGIIVDTYRSWRSHRTIRLGAGLAYYGLFAVVPLLSVSAAVAGVVLDDIDLEEALADVIGDIVDTDGSDIAAAIVDNVDTTGTLAGLGLVGTVSLVLAASLLFVALQDALDTVWETPYRRGARNTLRRRLLAFLVVVLSGAVLIANFVVSALSGLVRELAPADTELLETAADLLAMTGSWALAALVFALLFRYLTVAHVHWTVALGGGVATALALTIGTRLITEYLGRVGTSSIAGAAGSVILGLFWFYAIAQIVLAGAELTRTLQLTLGPVLDTPRRVTDGPATT